MPTQFPTPDFDRQFNEARETILQYFDYGREVQAESQRYLRSLPDYNNSQRPKKPRKVPARVCIEFANANGLSYSYTSQARKTARTFTDAQVERLLERFYEARYLPCRETFIFLTRVPKIDHARWIEAMIEENWSAQHLKRLSLQTYGNRSNGGKKKRPPGTLYEAQRDLDRIASHLEVVFDRFHEVRADRSGIPEGIDFRIPRSLLPMLTSCLASLDEVREEVAELAG